MEKEKFAIIDIGTLKIKFEIDEIDKQMNRKVIYRTKELTVMGRDLHKTNGIIVEESIQKAIQTLLMYKEILIKEHVHYCKVIATEALRLAKNVNQVLERIKTLTDFDVEIISAQQEAEVLFKSVAKDFSNKIIAVADIGGGSVQVTIGKDNEIFNIFTFKAGTYFMQEEFSNSHFPTKEELENAKKFLRRELVPLIKSKYKPEYIIYGTTNIIDFMKAMKIKLIEKDFSPSHPYEINIKQLTPVYEKIIKLPYEERMPLYTAEPYYMWAADKVIMIVEQISRYLKCETIVPTNNNTSVGLLENLAKEYYLENNNFTYDSF